MTTLRLCLGLLVVTSACTGEAESRPEAATENLIGAACMSGLKGVDVSWHNENVNWSKVKNSGRVFAFARVSDGITQLDEKFSRNWSGMKSAGLVRGAYQFFRARHGGEDQADVMLDALADEGGLKKGDLPPVLDLETADNQSASTVVSRAKKWLKRVKDRTGVMPIVYTGNQMNDIIGDAFADYPLWVAHYETSCPNVPDAWDRWTFWQNAEDGSCPGITEGGTDTDFFNGNRSKLDAMTLRHNVSLYAIHARELLPPSADEGRAAMGDGLRGLL